MPFANFISYCFALLLVAFLLNYYLKPAKIYPGLPDTIIAHRGASALAPENTLAAFQKAKDLNANFIEFDVVVSSADPDKTPFIFHDETVDRTTNAKGSLAQYSYAELKKLDAGSWFSRQFAGEKIPSLDEVAEWLVKNNMSANVEIKPLPGMDEITAEQAYNVVNKYFPQPNTKIIFSSFSIKSLQQLRKICPNCYIAILFKHWRNDWKIIAKSLKVVSINLRDDIVTKERINEIKAENYKVCTYTIDDTKQAMRLYALGVDAVFTNKPGKLKSRFR